MTRSIANSGPSAPVVRPVLVRASLWTRILERHRWKRLMARPRVPIVLLRYQRMQLPSRANANVVQRLTHQQIALQVHVSWASWIKRAQQINVTVPHFHFSSIEAPARVRLVPPPATRRHAFPRSTGGFEVTPKSVAIHPAMRRHAFPRSTERYEAAPKSVAIHTAIQSESRGWPAPTPGQVAIARFNGGSILTIRRRVRTGKDNSPEVLQEKERVWRSEPAKFVPVRSGQTASPTPSRIFSTTTLIARRALSERFGGFQASQPPSARIGGRSVMGVQTHRAANTAAPVFPGRTAAALTHSTQTVVRRADGEAPSLTFAKPPRAAATEPPPATKGGSLPANVQPAPAPIDVARLSDEVYRHINRKIRIDRERRGLLS